MSKLRSINTGIWSDNWFEDINPTSKLLFIYLITNEKNNMLGIYEMSVKKISFETGIDKQTIEKALKEFERVNKVSYIDGYIILNNFIKNQSYNVNMKKSAIDVYNLLPKEIKFKNLEFINIPEKANDKIAYAQLVTKGFQTLCERFGILRKVEDEVEDETKNEYKKTLLSELKSSDVLNNDYLIMAKSFHSMFRQNIIEAGSSTKTIDKAKGTWYDDIRLIIESDKNTIESLRKVYKFIKDNSFWKANIFSTSKLREQIPTLLLKIKSEEDMKNQSKEQPQVYEKSKTYEYL